MLLCFWIFAWKWRVDIIAAFLERVNDPYKVQIEEVQWKDRNTFLISGIQFRNQNQEVVLHVSEAELKTSFLSWASWCLIPAKNSLFLSTLTLKVNTLSHLSFNQTKIPFTIIVDEVVLIRPNGSKEIYVKQAGLLTEILYEVLKIE